MRAFITELFERIVTVILVLVFMQIPLFMQDYEQQLVGRIEELSLQMQALQKAAGTRSLQQYILKFQSSADPDFSNHGDFLNALVQRYESLTHTYTALTDASLLTKPFVFLVYLHQDVAVSTWQHYNIGLPLTLEGMMYAGIGLLVALMLPRKAPKNQKITG